MVLVLIDEKMLLPAGSSGVKALGTQKFSLLNGMIMLVESTQP